MAQLKKKLIWRGKKVVQVTKDQIKRNMGVATQFLRNEVIKSINVSQPTRRLASGGRVGLSPSKPGKPPKRVEGDLVRSIIAEVEITGTKVIGRYGSTQGKKAKALEFGTRKKKTKTSKKGAIRMKARPFLRPPLFKNKQKLVEMLTR